MESLQSTVTAKILNEGEVNNMKNSLNLIKPKSKDTSRVDITSGGAMTIVNSKDNGKRITISKGSMEYIGNPESVEIGFTEDGIVIGDKLPENGERFTLRKVGSKAVIYSAQLVKEITELFELDFSNRVSITFTDAEHIEMEYPMVKINIKNN